jgi:hypothetical protein
MCHTLDLLSADPRSEFVDLSAIALHFFSKQLGILFDTY